MREIRNIQDFRDCKAVRDGYIVIEDTVRVVIHSARCPNVDISDFRMKGLDNDGRNGRYFFFADIMEAMSSFRVKRCENCRPR